jgi:hypothetical protein
MEWINFCRDNKLGNDPCATLAEMKMAVTVTGTKVIKDTSGDGSDSFVPIFTLAKIGKQETLDAADAADAELQVYFDEIFSSEQVVDVPNIESNTPTLAPSSAYPEQPRTQSAMANYEPLVQPEKEGSFPTYSDEPKGDPEDGLPF